MLRTLVLNTCEEGREKGPAEKGASFLNLKGKVGSLPSHQLLWFLACITSTRDSNPDLSAPRPVALPRGHRVGDCILRKLRGHTGDFRNKFKDFLIGLFT